MIYGSASVVKGLEESEMIPQVLRAIRVSVSKFELFEWGFIRRV